MTETSSYSPVRSLLNRSGLLSSEPVPIAPLVTFRITFGLLMLASIIRFWLQGWITSLYVTPKFHFTYMGFGWVQPLGYTGMHLIFFVMGLAALMVAIGMYYRVAITTFFLTFTYVELIDVAPYLNHYYFISLVAFILIWLPANARYSVDVILKPRIARLTVPAWAIALLRFQMGVVYVFAGLAKINYDWLIEAQPMRIWLPSKSHLPLVGPLMYEAWVAYLFSWFGAVYDLFIVAFLNNKKTRPVAYTVVLIFHIATAIFFPAIGVFPYVMIVSSLIFFDGGFHNKLLSLLPYYSKTEPTVIIAQDSNSSRRQLINSLTVIYIVLQLTIPMRHLLYPGKLFWTEEGYRFSWRVMLMEKSGNAFFTVREKGKHKSIEVNNAVFLTPLQEKMMCTQPDLILKYAHYLAAEYRKRDVKEPEIYAEVYVTLNGARSELYIDSTVDLAKEQLSWGHYEWIRPSKK